MPSRSDRSTAASWDTLRDGGRTYYRFSLDRSGSPPFTVPTRIAHRYEPVALLARGGGGVILECRDHRTGQSVIAKALADYPHDEIDPIEPDGMFFEEVRRMRHHLQTERRILVQLRRRGTAAVPHPNDYVFDRNPSLAETRQIESGKTWQCSDAALVDSEPYLIMQRLPGRPLDQLLDCHFPHGMPGLLAVGLLRQIVAVLELLHQPFEMRGGRTWQLVYQDLKPSNILVDDAGHAALLDFGGCQLVINEVLVLHGSYTRGYSAPECTADEAAVSASADCYPVGATLLHMLSGNPPVSAEGPRGERAAEQAGRVAPPLAAFLARCLQADPAHRFATISELRSELDSMVLG